MLLWLSWPDWLFTKKVKYIKDIKLQRGFTNAARQTIELCRWRILSTYSNGNRSWSLKSVLCMYVCIYICIYTHTHTRCIIKVMPSRLFECELTERRHYKPAVEWPAWPTGRCRLPRRSRCGSGQRSTTGRWRAPPESETAARYWQSPLSDEGRVKDQAVGGR